MYNIFNGYSFSFSHISHKFNFNGMCETSHIGDVVQNRSRELTDFAQWRAVPAVVLVARATSHNSGYATCPSEHANARPATSHIRAPLGVIKFLHFLFFCDWVIGEGGRIRTSD